jgi:hypothetical protein
LGTNGSSQERWATPDQAHEQQKAPGCPVPGGGKGRDDTEAPGRVVKRESDDEEGRECKLAGRGLPMANPSPKLCRPIPTAISSAKRRTSDQPARPVGRTEGALEAPARECAGCALERCLSHCS